jgi:ABC-type sulfate/molybdate transport systems ATPase subunit
MYAYSDSVLLSVSSSCRSTNAEGRRTKTTLLVTHRFNTVRRADKIAVFEKGSIKEIGTHQELMQIEGEINLLPLSRNANDAAYAGGLYREFYNIQASSFAD